MGALADALSELLEQRTRRHPVVVWYDPGGTLTNVASQAVPGSVRLLAYEGSYLELRSRFEEANPHLEGHWLLYVPEQRLEPSWLRDLELAGGMLDLGLSTLASEAFGLATTPRLRSLLSGRPGSLLAARWDELILSNRPVAADVERAMVAAVLNLGAGARLQEIAINYVSRGDGAVVLARADLHPELRALLRSEGGLQGLPDGEVPEQRIAAALLLSEAVEHGKLDPQPFGEALPVADRIAQWCAWAEIWMQRADDSSFRQWSEQISRLYRVRDHLVGPDVADVNAFADVDDVLLREAERLLDDGEPERLREVAQRRRDTRWAKAAEAQGEPLPWDPLIAALDLLQGAEAAEREHVGRESWQLNELLRSFSTETGWWRLDDAYRRLEANWSRIPDRLAQRIAEPASRAYDTFLESLGSAACKAIEAASDWSADGWQSQRTVAARALGGSSRVGVVLADALRFDLGRLLAERLRAKGVDVELVPTLVDLPSVTQVGMAAIQVPTWLAREVAIETSGKFFPRVNGTVLRSREDRLAQLRARFPQARGIELDVVQVGQTIPRANPLIVYAGAVDEQGDALPQIGLDLFERFVWGISHGVEKLLSSGYSQVAVIPDHGFVLAPRGCDVRTIEAPGTGPGTVRSRRYVIGHPADSEDLARVSGTALGWQGHVAAAFPRGLAVVSLPGEIPRFFHGGPMPQETAVLSLICRRPQSAVSPVGVRLTGPEHIDTTVPRFTLEGEAQDLLARPRRVRVVVRLDDRVVGESEALELQAGEEREAIVRLTRYGRYVEILVEDVETREVLTTRTIPVELPPGYEDLGL